MQQQWKFQDVTGIIYTIGVFHGEEKGHFLLYINNQISIIDFSVLEDKIYPIYIGNELFQFKILKQESGGFKYVMKNISPRLQMAPWEKTRDKVIPYVLLFIVLTIVFFLIMWWTDTSLIG